MGKDRRSGPPRRFEDSVLMELREKIDTTAQKNAVVEAWIMTHDRLCLERYNNISLLMGRMISVLAWAGIALFGAMGTAIIMLINITLNTP